MLAQQDHQQTQMIQQFQMTSVTDSDREVSFQACGDEAMAGGKASPQRQWRTDNDTRERETKTPDLKRLLQTTRNLHRPVARRVDRIVCIAACAIALIVGMLPASALAQTRIAALKKAGSRPIAAWQTKVSPEAVAILDWANRQ
jgi:hypothetical protein